MSKNNDSLQRIIQALFAPLKSADFAIPFKIRSLHGSVIFVQSVSNELTSTAKGHVGVDQQLNFVSLFMAHALIDFIDDTGNDFETSKKQTTFNWQEAAVAILAALVALDKVTTHLTVRCADNEKKRIVLLVSSSLVPLVNCFLKRNPLF